MTSQGSEFKTKDWTINIIRTAPWKSDDHHVAGSRLANSHYTVKDAIQEPNILFPPIHFAALIPVKSVIQVTIRSSFNLTGKNSYGATSAWRSKMEQTILTKISFRMCILCKFDFRLWKLFVEEKMWKLFKVELFLYWHCQFDRIDSIQ